MVKNKPYPTQNIHLIIFQYQLIISNGMKHIFCIFVIFLAINSLKSEKRFQKIYECKSNHELLNIERCDMSDGKLCFITETVKPINNPYVRRINEFNKIQSRISI